MEMLEQPLPKSAMPRLESFPIRRRLLRLTCIFAVLATSSLAVITLSAQPVFGSAPTKTPDPRELDDFIETQLGQKPFVGISVALLQGGKMTFCKGYGYAYASKETKKPVDTETRFAVASVTTVLSPIPLVLKPPKATARL
jgi:hypothetical protein